MRRALPGSRAQKQCCPPERNRSTEPRPGCPQETPSPWTSVCLGRFEKRPAPAIALCTPYPARSCSGSSLGFHRGSAFVEPNLTLQECVPSSCWKQHRQPGQHISNSSAHRQLHRERDRSSRNSPSQGTGVWQRLNAHRYPRHLSPPKPGCGPGKPSKAIPMG